MSSQELDAGEPAPSPISIFDTTTETPEYSLPEIRFSEPTDEEANQLKLHLSDNLEVIGTEPQAFFSDNESSKESADLQHLLSYDFPPESIAEGARISDPDKKWSRTPNGNSYASFGDEGTTVTVNAYGSIMQITRSLGYGHSGLFCVETSEVCGPNSPQRRLEHLMQLSRSPGKGIRLTFLDDLMSKTSPSRKAPQMEFIFNRWPRFTSEQAELRVGNEAKHPSWSLQYFCDDGTVFQRYTFCHDPEGLSALQKVRFCIPLDFLIRTLDFANESKFNDPDVQSDRYVYLSGPKAHSQIVVHRMTGLEAKEIGMEKEYREVNGPKAAALVVTAFVNGKVQALYRLPSLLYISLSGEAEREVSTSKIVDVTIAYRLQTFTNNQSWKQSFTPATALKTMGTVFSEESGSSYHDIQWSSHDHINFITGRNLEHILSVCSMPMPKTSNSGAGKIEMDTASIALTCGDMSGHRIAATASFFAFQFLIEILTYLSDKARKSSDYLKDPNRCHCYTGYRWKCGACDKLGSYVHKLRARILKTLEAHLTWTATAKSLENLDATDFWITGKKIVGLQGHRSSSSATLMDIPFEIIKSHNLYQLYKANEEYIFHIKSDDMEHMKIMKGILGQAFPPRESVLNTRLQGLILHWLRKLSEREKQGQWAFSRIQGDDGGKKYHLSDHVWICRAVACIEALGLEQHLQLHARPPDLELPRTGDDENANQTEDQAPIEHETAVWSAQLQKVVLKRFTTRNPQSQRRMLATSRTPSETRFLFHARDTALFYAMDHGFFDRETKQTDRRTNWTNKLDVWKETIKAQAEHEEPQTLDWEKPLWYALAFIVSSKRMRVNKMPADGMLHATSKVLFRLSSSSGLFPGLLNDKLEPTIFEKEVEIDKYWHVTFEIPYAMWIYGKGLEASLDQKRSEVFEEQLQQKSQVKNGRQLLQPIKKKMDLVLLSSSVDKYPLVETSDDWLREIPSSLNFDNSVSFADLHTGYYLHGRTSHEDFPNFGRAINSSIEGNIEESSDQLFVGVIIDIPKGSSNSKVSRGRSSLRGGLKSSSWMKAILQAPRTIAQAKKRLIWLPQADWQTALVCCNTSSQTEQDNLSAFFDRHTTYENHFSDYTSEALNEWVTELHLSYFRRTDWDPTKNEIREKCQSIIPDLSCILVDPQMMPGHDGRNTRGAKIVRSVMSFRFVGDFSDRYWTCHFIECDPSKAQSEQESREFIPLAERLSTLGSDPVQEMKSPWRKKQPWQQRKVLELLLLEHILRQILSSTDGLLSWVRDVILKKDRISNVDGIDMVSVLEMPFRVRATKPLNPLAEAVEASVESLVGNEGDGLFAIAERWRFFEQVLKIMEEGLSGNLQVISSWTIREREREAEGLRWTRNDQVLYQQVIDKLRISNQRKIRELDGLRVAIGTFRNTFSRKLDTMRSDLEYRYSENTSLFTYVTVVFLPLGFATGILSMSGTPDRPTLISMIELALVAMAITLFALANARTTGKKIVQPVIIIFRSISNGSVNPLLNVLLPPFRILKNILLLLGNAIKFFLLVGFHLFISLPLIHALGPDNVESIRHAYHSVQEASQSIEERLAAGRNRDPWKVAEKSFNARKNQRGDEEQG